MSACPACGALIAQNQQYCSQCGSAAVIAPVDGVDGRHLKSPGAHLATARTWLMVVAIMTFLSAFLIHAMQSKKVEQEIQTAEQQTRDVAPEVRDAYMQAEMGMTWEEAKAHDRGTVRMLLYINLALSLVYFGLWYWARQNPYMAALLALLLFVGVHAVSAIVEPSSLAQGILIKVLFVAALTRAVMAGHAARVSRRAPAV